MEGPSFKSLNLCSKKRQMSHLVRNVCPPQKSYHQWTVVSQIFVESMSATAATKAMEDEAVKAANEKKGDQKKEHVLYSEEYYTAQKAKRHSFRLIKFIRELFKLQMLTERIMHECVKKLLGNVSNPEEHEIKS